MSSARSWLMTSSSAAPGSAPGWLYTRAPSLNAMSVGTELMPAVAANDEFSSMSTLANTMSGCLSDAASKMGPKLRHGPHHVAQKSTSTMVPCVTTCSNVSAVSVCVAITSPLLVCQQPAWCAHGRPVVMLVPG